MTIVVSQMERNLRRLETHQLAEGAAVSREAPSTDPEVRSHQLCLSTGMLKQNVVNHTDLYLFIFPDKVRHLELERHGQWTAALMTLTAGQTH